MQPRRPLNFAHFAPHGGSLSGALVFYPPAVALLSRSPGCVAPLAPSSTASTGFTNPSVIRDKLNKIDTSAQNLNASIRENIPVEGEGAAFIARWVPWFENWNEHFDKYSGTSLTIWTNSDEVNDQTDTLGKELDGWYADYAKQKGVDGKPVKAPLGQPPGFFASVPSWQIALGALALAGAGYAGYRYVKASSQSKGRRRK